VAWRESLLQDVESAEHQLVVLERAGEIIGYGRARLLEPEPDGLWDAQTRLPISGAAFAARSW